MKSNKAKAAKGKRRNILILLQHTGASSRDFLIGFSQFARSRSDWHLHLRHASDLSMEDIASTIMQSGYDGIVTNEDTFLQFPAIASNPRTAVVVFGTYRQLDTPAPLVFVQNDNHEIGRFGARFLAQLGRFRTFGFVPTSRPHSWSDIRVEGFRAGIGSNQHNCSVFDWGDPSCPLAIWLKALPKPAAVMAACDRQAVEVVECCGRAGLAVPEQVAVLGVDNDELLCEFESPTLSSLLPRHDTTGFLAAKTLNRLFRGWRPKGSERVLCSDQNVVERESTAPLAPATHLILSALDFIRRNATNNITVMDVVRHLNVSRALADLRFREFQGESIGRTIARIRLEEVKKRLLSTKLPVGKLARVCGFPNAAHLGALFKRHFGVTPGQWRLAHLK